MLVTTDYATAVRARSSLSRRWTAPSRAPLIRCMRRRHRSTAHSRRQTTVTPRAVRKNWPGYVEPKRSVDVEMMTASAAGDPDPAPRQVGTGRIPLILAVRALHQSRKREFAAHLNPERSGDEIEHGYAFGGSGEGGTGYPAGDSAAVRGRRESPDRNCGSARRRQYRSDAICPGRHFSRFASARR